MEIVDKLNEVAIKYRKELMLVTVIGLERSLVHMTLRPGIAWKETVGELFANAELKVYDGEKNLQTPFSTKARELEVFLGSLVTEEDPKQLMKTLWGDQILGTLNKASKHPLEALMITAVLKNISKKLNLHLFDAVRNASSPSTSTTADLFNGFDTITAAEITAGNISTGKSNLIELDAFTTSNAVDQLKELYEAAHDVLQDEPSKLFISKDIYNKYCKDYQTTYGSLPYNTQYKKTFLEGSDDNCELVPLVGKKDSIFLHLTKKSNMLVGVDLMNDMEELRVRECDNPFKVQFVNTQKFGVQLESIEPENLMVGKIV